MKARLGISPVAWSNGDLPEWGGDTTLETCLKESRETGFSGIEDGGKFPETPHEMKAVLAEYGLKLVSGRYPGRVLQGDFLEEKDRVAAQIERLRENGAGVIVYGETIGSVQGLRDVALGRRPRLDDEQMRAYGRRITAFAEFCHEAGVPLAYQHHAAAVIATEDDIGRLMNFTGDAVGLVLDTGHIALAGGDALSLARRHGARIVHLRARDLRGHVIAGVDRERHSFIDVVLAGAFTTPGDGAIEFKAVAEVAAEIGYEGWFVVVSEQDPRKANPAEYARIGHEVMAEGLAEAGYEFED